MQHKDTIEAGAIRFGGEVLTPESFAGSYESEFDPSHHVNAPGHVLARRALLRPHLRRLESTARECCLFVLGIGQPEDRTSSRVGGLAYWPSDLPWPMSSAGEPMEFVGQLDFRHLTWPEPLPGDILTIHTDPQHDDQLGWSGVGAHLQWHTVNAVALIESNPDADLWSSVGPYYCVPVRETDYKVDEPPAGLEFADVTIHGVKIGGHSPFQADNVAEVLEQLRRPVFLCSINCLPNGAAVAKQPEIWLPPKGQMAPESVNELYFVACSTLTLVYEQGHPERIFWVTYLP